VNIGEELMNVKPTGVGLGIAMERRWGRRTRVAADSRDLPAIEWADWIRHRRQFPAPGNPLFGVRRSARKHDSTD